MIREPHYCRLPWKDEWDSVWVDQTGREYYCFCEIEDSHLVNIVHMLQRRGCLPFPNFQGELAQEYAEQEWVAYEEGRDETLSDMTEELKRRGVDTT